MPLPPHLKPNYVRTGDCHPLYGPACRAEPIDPATIQASRDGELPRRRAPAGCPTCGCPTHGVH